MHVAVAIVGFRNADDIVTCLAALERSTHQAFEVVVCENGGAEAYRRLVSAAPARLAGGQLVRLVEAPRNLGYAGGVNLAMAQAPEADAWWVLNPDTEAEPGAMAACVARLEAGGCEAVGSIIYLPDGRVQAYGGRWQRLLGRAVALGQGRRLEDAMDVSAIEREQSYISGAAALVSRRFFKTVGPMREDYFLYCEEVEWFLRGAAMGMRLGFAAEARVRHDAGSTTGSGAAFREMPKTPVYLNERNRILLTRDLTWWLLPIVIPASVGVFLMRYGRRRAWRQLGYAFAGWIAGVTDQRGPPAWLAGPVASTSPSGRH